MNLTARVETSMSSRIPTAVAKTPSDNQKINVEPNRGVPTLENVPEQDHEDSACISPRYVGLTTNTEVY